MSISTQPLSRSLRSRTGTLRTTRQQENSSKDSLNTMSDHRSDEDEVIYDSSINHRSPSHMNTRNRGRTLSNSSTNHDREPLLEDNINNTDTTNNGYVERVVILTDDVDESLRQGGDEDSGISCEEHLLRDEDHVNSRRQRPKETIIHVAMQVSIPFLIAGLGMMLAGLLLDKVQHWEVYEELNEIFILVPALLGLKGNLEMTLASRLSTAANVGQLDSWRSTWRLTWGNLALIQGQALVVAGLATVISIILGRDLSGSHQLLLGASAMGAASIASAILGSVMIGVILISHLVKINPDNVATPIAASLGDLVTLGLLSVLARGLFEFGKHHGMMDNDLLENTTMNATTLDYAEMTSSSSSATATSVTTHTTKTLASTGVIVVILLVLIPVWLTLAYKNSTTRSVLYYGWFPVISAMIISSGGGWVLSLAVNKWKGIAVYSPIINGVGGNLVAIQASRISTSLHQLSTLGSLPSDPNQRYRGPLRTFFSKSFHSKTALLLVSFVLPGSAIFLLLIHLLQAGHTTLSALFFVGYIGCALLQVLILLGVADWMVHSVWKWGYDPDNIAIPFLTALGDLLGTGLLSLGFLLMWLVGDRDEDVGD